MLSYLGDVPHVYCALQDPAGVLHFWSGALRVALQADSLVVSREAEFPRCELMRSYWM